MPKDNEVDEKVIPEGAVAVVSGVWSIMWAGDRSVAHMATKHNLSIGDYLYSPATVAELRAEVIKERERAEKFMWQVRDTCARAEAAERRVANALALADSWQALADKFVALGGDIAVAEAASMTNDARQLRAILTGADPT